MRDLILVKLGGSLLTDKRRPQHPRQDVIERLAVEIATATGGDSPALLIGHGSGSFGHVAAVQHGWRSEGAPPTRLAASATQHAAAGLHRLVIDALLQAKVPACSLPPSGWMVARAGRPATTNLAPLYLALDRGWVPVVCGDVVMDQVFGSAIVSTETVFDALVTRLRRRGHVIRRLLWLGETEGVYDATGKTISTIDLQSYRAVLESVDAPAGTDVTGGMMLRLATARSLARRGIESWIGNGVVPGRLAAALHGFAPGTRFLPPPT